MWVVFPWNTCSLPRQQRKLGRTQRVSNAAMSLTTTGLTLMSTVVRSTWRIVEEEQSKNHASIQFIILSFYRRSLSIRPILERFSVAYAAKFLATLLINCYIVEVTKSFKKESGKTNGYISFCFLRSVWFKWRMFRNRVLSYRHLLKVKSSSFWRWAKNITKGSHFCAITKRQEFRLAVPTKRLTVQQCEVDSIDILLFSALGKSSNISCITRHWWLDSEKEKHRSWEYNCVILPAESNKQWTTTKLSKTLNSFTPKSDQHVIFTS